MAKTDTMCQQAHDFASCMTKTYTQKVKSLNHIVEPVSYQVSSGNIYNDKLKTLHTKVIH